MIVSLKFNNFRSYRDEAEFSMRALDSDFNSESVTVVSLSDNSSIRLLNAAVIFGANASGKSNVIYALAALSDSIKESLNFNVKSHPFFIMPYAFDKAYQNKATSLQLEFIFDGKLYLYSVAGKGNRITAESLKEVNSGKNRIIFKRMANGKMSVGSGWPAERNVAEDCDLLPNQLIMSWLATKNAAGLQNIADYIGNLSIYWGNHHSGSSSDRQVVMETIIKDTKSKIFKQLSTLLHVADLGVASIIANRNADSDFKLPESIESSVRETFISQNRWNISLGHSTSNPMEICVLNFASESEGTKAIFGVGARLLNALATGAFVAYDEINDAIHPALLRFLVSLFQSKKSNPKGAQLLFSTHDASVADHDTLRADQVWFVEKKDAVSDLYSAQDFDDVSIRVPFETWYRAGRFGALPKIGDFEEIFKN